MLTLKTSCFVAKKRSNQQFPLSLLFLGDFRSPLLISLSRIEMLRK